MMAFLRHVPLTQRRVYFDEWSWLTAEKLSFLNVLIGANYAL